MSLKKVSARAFHREAALTEPFTVWWPRAKLLLREQIDYELSTTKQTRYEGLKTLHDRPLLDAKLTNIAALALAGYHKSLPQIERYAAEIQLESLMLIAQIQQHHDNTLDNVQDFAHGQFQHMEERIRRSSGKTDPVEHLTNFKISFGRWRTTLQLPATLQSQIKELSK